jgi:hypothetical protein
VYASGTFTLSGGSVEGNAAYSSGGGVYLGSSAALAKTGGTIFGNDASDTARQNKVINDSTVYTDRGAAVWVAAAGTTQAHLEKTVDDGHDLTKAATDTTAESLTAAKGWYD